MSEILNLIASNPVMLDTSIADEGGRKSMKGDFTKNRERDFQKLQIPFFMGFGTNVCEIFFDGISNKRGERKQ